MSNHKLTLQISDMNMAICRFASDSSLPGWVREDRFVSITRTPDELSLVCCEECVPADVSAERGWRLIKLKGPLDLNLTGVLASLVTPLAGAGIPIFALSTYETDYLLVKNDQLQNAIGVLERTCNIEKYHGSGMIH